MMRTLICPLCCQQGFTSVIALREHLLYYIYRPLVCPLCNISVGGINGLTQHLQSHLIDNKQVITNVTEEPKQNQSPSLYSRRSNNENKTDQQCSKRMSFIQSFQPLSLNTDDEHAAIWQFSKSNINFENKSKCLNSDRKFVSSTCPSFNDGSEKNLEMKSLFYENVPADHEMVRANFILNKEPLLHKENEKRLHCFKNIRCDRNNQETKINKNWSDSPSDSFPSLLKKNIVHGSNSSTLTSKSVLCQEEDEQGRISCRETKSAIDRKRSEGFQAFSEALRAFVCNTCGAKIVGKDIYFKHIQEDCKQKTNVGSLNDKQKCLTDNFNIKEEEIIGLSTSASVREDITAKFCQKTSDYIDPINVPISQESRAETSSVAEVSTVCPNKDDDSSSLIHMGEEGKEVTSKPYIHKKFDHDQGRKGSNGPSGDIQCYIQNFQSLLVDKLNQTLGNDSNETSMLDLYTTNMDDSLFDSSSQLSEMQSSGSESVVEEDSLLTLSDREDSDSLRSVSEVQSVDATETTTKQNGTIRCKYCNKTFSKRYMLQRHQKELHATMTFLCNLCGHHFKSKRTLENHKGTHKDKTFICTKCDYSCFTASGLRSHTFEVHSSTQKKLFCCTICSEHFKRKYGLYRHMQRKHETNKSLCRFCDKEFSCKEDLVIHMTIHINDIALTCNVCNKLFTSKGSLKRHSATHSAERVSFQCNVCSTTFTRKDSLQAHSRLHESNSALVCDFEMVSS